jgi:hypothetical protein
VDVNYQELIAMRNNNVWPARYQQNRVYAIGPPVNVDNPVSDGVAASNVSDTYDLTSSSNALPLFAVGTIVAIEGFPDAANNGSFTLDVINSTGGNWGITKVDGSAVGIAEGPFAITVGSTPVNRLSLLSGNPADDRIIVVYHDVALRKTDVGNGDLDKPIPFPAYCHNAIYTYVSWIANRSKNDKRDARFHADYKKALSQAIISGRPKQTRPQQMPMSVGRMW